jgi:hypothetical protein
MGSGEPDVRAIVTQTADPELLALHTTLFPGLQLLVDGRNSGDIPLPEGVAYRGIGIRR